MKGDERRQSSQREQSIEEQGDNISHNGHGGERLVEDIRQGNKHQRCTTVGAYTHGESGGEDHQTGKDSDERVDGRDLNSRGEQVCLLAVVAGIGGEAAHADAKRIERLAKGPEEHAGIDPRKIGLEQEANAFGCSWQHARCHDDDEQQDEKRGHE